MLKYCRDNCIFLSPKEKNQTERKEKHFCYLFKKIITHLVFHPKLVTTCKCPFAKKVSALRRKK